MKVEGADGCPWCGIVNGQRVKDLVRTVQALRIRSIAIPPFGCGNGGLDWNQIRPGIEAALTEVPEVEVLIYEPVGAPPTPAALGFRRLGKGP